jgi:hypothetical protein
MKLTMKSYAAAVLGFLLIAMMGWAIDNPLKDAKVGEWLQFASHTEVMGQKRDTKMKLTVVAKDAVSVTLRTVMDMGMGKETPPQDVKFMLDKPYEPVKTGSSDAVVTQLGEGYETLVVGGKSYACHWIKVKTVETKPLALESISTVWGCKDVPVNHMVKMESEATTTRGGKVLTTKTITELIDASK